MFAVDMILIRGKGDRFGNITCMTLLLIIPEMASTEKRRPFFIIGHMANSLYDVDVFVEHGANAIEADIQFSPDGKVTWVYHGVPCDCYRTCTRYATFPEYLDYMRNVTSVHGGKFKGKVLFLLLDLKTSGISQQRKYQAGADVATKLVRHLWRQVSTENALDVMVHVSSLDDKEIFRGVLDTIRARTNSTAWVEHVGFEFGYFDSPSRTGKVFAELGISGRRWQGHGMTNCLPYRGYHKLQEIVACRDGKSSRCDYIDKGYAWTLDKEWSIAREIMLGLDGVITNYPGSALAALKLEVVAKVARLAGPQDSPWTRVVNKG